jgi:hypothetical protein
MQSQNLYGRHPLDSKFRSISIFRLKTTKKEPSDLFYGVFYEEN